MSDTLVNIVNGGQSWAADRANYALQIHSAVISGQCSREEATELLKNLIASQELAEAATDQQMMAMLVFGVEELINIYA